MQKKSSLLLSTISVWKYVVEMLPSQRHILQRNRGTKHQNKQYFCKPKTKIRRITKAARSANVQRQIRGH